MKSNNEVAAQLVGMREDNGPLLDNPAELGFHCPVCQYALFHDDDYDDRLSWGQYNGFLLCSACENEYPATLCMPDVERAIKIYLLSIKEAIERKQVEQSGVG